MKYKVQNFRVFDQEGFEFDLSKPITFLTGCNSSGKSSLVKSLLVLNNYLEGLREDYKKTNDFNLLKHTLGLGKIAYQLGNYKSVLHRGETDGLLHFSYTIQPKQTLIPFTVEFIFEESKDDAMNDASLKQLIVTSDDKIILKISIQDKQPILDSYNFVPLKESYFQYSLLLHVLNFNDIKDAWDEYGDGGYTDEEMSKMEKDEENLLSAFQYQFSEEHIQSFKIHKANDKDYKIEDDYSFRQSVFQNLIYYSPLVDFLKDGPKSEIGDKIRSLCDEIDYKIEDDYSFRQSVFQNLIYYSPLVDFLKDCPKSEIGDKIRSLCDKKDDNVEAAIRHFEKSPFENFSDYLRDLENTHGLSFNGHIRFITEDLLYNLKEETYGKFKSEWSYSEYELSSVLYEFDQRHNEEIEELRENPDFEFILNAYFELAAKLDNKFKDLRFYIENNDTIAEPHPGFEQFYRYVSCVMVSLLNPDEFRNVHYISSESAKIKRLYSLDGENDSFSRILMKYIEAKRNYNKNEYEDSYNPDEFLNTWLQKFEIAHHVSIKNTDDGLGVTLRVFTDENDKEGHLLADEGYGMTQLFSIILGIETLALSIPKHIISRDNMKEEYDYSLMAIEEPENHLHPSYQSMLAKMFYDAYKSFNIHFIVETHSEYMIRKSQLITADMNFTSNDEADEKSEFITYYMPKDGIPYSLGYRKDGKFKEQFGTGFFDEASNLAFELL